jgi:hypothetical protein
MLGVEIRDNNRPLGNSFSIRKKQSNPATQKRCSPYAAPSTEAFERNSPLGATHGCGALPKGQEAPFGDPVQKLRSAGKKRHPGRLFFGYFLLAEQKKVSRSSVREPTSKELVALATHYSAIHQIRAGTKTINQLLI